MGFLKELFCSHVWKVESRNRYNIINSDGNKDGEVTLLVKTCFKCGKTTIRPINRTDKTGN